MVSVSDGDLRTWSAQCGKPQPLPCAWLWRPCSTRGRPDTRPRASQLRGQQGTARGRRARFLVLGTRSGISEGVSEGRGEAGHGEGMVLSPAAQEGVERFPLTVLCFDCPEAIMTCFLRSGFSLGSLSG